MLCQYLIFAFIMSAIINPLLNSNIELDNNTNIKAPRDLVKQNELLNVKYEEKIYEVKKLFILHKLNEESGEYQRAYEKATHELNDIKKEKSELNNNLMLSSNMLNLKLYSLDDQLNIELRKTNNLKTKIQNEDDESNSFQQMKEDEVNEYRLNLYYIIGILVGTGILVKQIKDFFIKK